MLVHFFPFAVLLAASRVFCEDIALSQSLYIYNYTALLTISEGSEAVLMCYAKGTPTPEITWRRTKRKPLSTSGRVFRGNILTIPNITKEDSGSYYCTANNGIGPKYRTVCNVVVVFAPLVSAPKPFVKVVLPFKVSLQCHVQTSPLSTIIWLHKGVQLFNNSYYTISHYITNENNNNMISTLSINVQRKHHFGEYTCRAWNIYGVAETKIKLKRKHL